jgi:hypothetical protein
VSLATEFEPLSYPYRMMLRNFVLKTQRKITFVDSAIINKTADVTHNLDAGYGV